MRNVATTLEQGKQKISETLKNGKALEKFQNMLVYQDVDSAVADTLCNGDMWSVLPRVPDSQISIIEASKTGNSTVQWPTLFAMVTCEVYCPMYLIARSPLLKPLKQVIQQCSGRHSLQW